MGEISDPVEDNEEELGDMGDLYARNKEDKLLLHLEQKKEGCWYW